MRAAAAALCLLIGASVAEAQLCLRLSDAGNRSSAYPECSNSSDGRVSIGERGFVLLEMLSLDHRRQGAGAPAELQLITNISVTNETLLSPAGLALRGARAAPCNASAAGSSGASPRRVACLSLHFSPAAGLQGWANLSGVASYRNSSSGDVFNQSFAYQLQVVPPLRLVDAVMAEDTVLRWQLRTRGGSAPPLEAFAVHVLNSSNAQLLPMHAVRMVVRAGVWGVELAPRRDQHGETRITLSVDAGVVCSFLVRVLPVNDVPEIRDQKLQENTSSIVCCHNTSSVVVTTFRMVDVESNASSLKITVESTNLLLVPLERVAVVRVGDNVTVTVRPRHVMCGRFMVRVRVSDGGNSTTTVVARGYISVSTVDLTLHLGADISDFSSAAARTRAEKDLADAARVDAAQVSVLAVQPGSVVIIAAINFSSPEAAKLIVTNIGREMTFGRFALAAKPVLSLSINVVGEQTRECCTLSQYMEADIQIALGVSSL